MRKIILSGGAAIGLLAVGMTVIGQPAAFRLAADGSGADVRVTRHNLVAMINTDRTTRPLLVAMVEPPDPC